MKLKNILIHASYISAISISILSSCIKKAEFKSYGAPEDLHGKITVPIINSSLRLSQVVDKNLSSFSISKDTDSSYFVSLSDQIVSDKVEDMFKLDDATVSDTTQFTGLTPVPFTPVGQPIDLGVQAIQSLSFDVQFKDSLEFNYIDLKEGEIELNVATSLQHTVYYTISCSSLIKNGQTLLITDSIVNPSSSKSSPKINLAGYRLLLANAGSPSTKFNASVMISAKSSGAAINASEDVRYTFAVTGLKFKRFVGRIKDIPFPTVTQGIAIGAFDNKFFQNIKLADPQISLSFDNSFGVPVSLNLSQISSKGSNGQMGSLNFTPTNAGILNLNYPDTTEFGQVKSTTFNININNSNISSFLYTPIPDSLKIAMSGKVGSPTGYHFIEDTSRIKMKYTLKIPAYGQISNFVIKDTIQYKFEDLTVNKATFKFDINNEMPVSAKVQLYVFDRNYNVIDSILVSQPNQTDNIIEAATNVDVITGKAQTPTRKIMSIERDDIWYQKIKANGTNLVIAATINTTQKNGQGVDVKFFGDQKIDVKVTFFLDGKVIIK